MAFAFFGGEDNNEVCKKSFISYNGLLLTFIENKWTHRLHFSEINAFTLVECDAFDGKVCLRAGLNYQYHNFLICIPRRTDKSGSLEVLGSLYFIERQPSRTTTTKTQKIYPGSKIFDKVLSMVSYYLPIGKTSLSGTQGMFFVFLQDKTKCSITQLFKLKLNITFKGPICNTIIILKHKIRMTCYQRLKKYGKLKYWLLPM